MLSGSVAMSVYIVPRATRDFDFVVNLTNEKIPLLLEFFKTGYCCDESAIKEAVKRESIFNIIDYKSGFKADFIILKSIAYRQEEFRRKVLTDLFGLPLYIVSPEDLILSKLIWIQELQSGLQIEDIRSLLSLDSIDMEYIYKWVKQLKLNTFELL
jgi:hypothetical protein